MLRPYRLEREIDRALAQWLDWLPRWEPATMRRRLTPCPACPVWAAELNLDDLPHGALHALTTSLEAIITEHLRRSVSLEPHQSDATLDLMREQLRGDAVAWLARQHAQIVRAVDAFVEPKVQHMAALLVADITAV